MDQHPHNPEQLKILQLIAAGTISAAEGEVLLQKLDDFEDQSPKSQQPVEGELLQPSPNAPPRPAWAHQALLLLGLGAFFAALGLAYSLLALTSSLVHWGWFFLAGPLTLFGVALFLLGHFARSGPWLHVKIIDADTRINFSLPLPLHWTVWLVRLTRRFVPKLQDLIADDLLEMLAQSITSGAFDIDINEESGEQVRIYYG